ncbi:MAG: hypothetical protein GXP26_09945 [Planctomycetes bacterium]|nr:hypothetical protein [Planctomycetota bacterium]
MPDQPSDPKSRQLPALRFSLRSMMIAMTAFALWCGFVAVLPTPLSQLLVGSLWFVATGWLATGLFFAKGDQRAFCIGAVLVVSSMWTGIGGQYMNGFHRLVSLGQPWAVWIDFGMIAVTAIANGYFCILARRYYERRHPEL